MERVLEFEKFRNIGFNQREKLILNYSLEKGMMGNLVILVGANNSGKSNVLDGLAEFANLKLESKDTTTLSYEDENRHPILTLCVKDGEDVYYYKLTDNKAKNKVGYPKLKVDYKTMKKEDLEILEIIHSAYNEYGLEEVNQVKQTIDRLNKTDNESEIEEIDDSLANIIRELKSKVRDYGHYYRYALDFIRSRCNNERHFLNSSNESAEVKLNKIFADKYGIDFFPNIYVYCESPIFDKNLKITVKEIDTNIFFKALFSAIHMESKEIDNAYTSFYNIGNKGILKDLENKINKKLKAVAKSFNNLYCFEKESYKFEVDLESEKIFFTMRRGEQSIILDYQSTGFKWFFNLYFNLLCANTLKPGDIVLMDEPATNLHVRGQQELRAFLKEFAMKNGITIVLATHSPFLIDLDYLDELRVVSMENGISCICNDFSTIDTEDPDSLKPIKEALTITNNNLYDPDTKVVFVEGITDYNYMVAFKKKFNKGDVKYDVVFLPVHGIGKFGSTEFKDKQKEISKQLIKIKKHSPILMVDGDRAGKSMKETNKESELTVFALTDINPEFKTIENLFSANDLKNFGIIMEDGKYVKQSSTSSLLKNFGINSENVSSETEKNFRQVFDYIFNL